MRLNAQVRRRIDAIREDRVHGAGWLSRRAISVMALSARMSDAESIAVFLEELRGLAVELATLRPSMTPVANGVCPLLRLIEAEAKEEPDLAHLQQYAQAAARRLVRASLRATQRAAACAAALISSGDAVMTCSYSATVIKGFEMAKGKGKEFSLIVARSESRDGRAYGEAMAQKLAPRGIPTEVIPDDALEARASKASKALVGADTVFPDGSIINGAPTLRLAQSAKKYGIPFYVVCEAAKFDRRGQAPVLEEGFEVIPAELIAGIITEEGLLRPRVVGQNPTCRNNLGRPHWGGPTGA